MLADGPAAVRVAVRRGSDRVVVDVPREQVRLVRRLPGEHERLALEGEQALLQGDVAAAISAFAPLAAARPDDPRALRELGFALLLAERPAEAEEALARACALDALDLEAHLQRARVLERLGRTDEAIAAWKRAATLGPRHVASWRAAARLLLARARGRDREEAVRCLELALREDPTSEAAALDLVDALAPGLARLPLPGRGLDEGQARARGALEPFVARSPGAVRAGLALARLEALAGEPRRARDRVAALVARPEVEAGLRARLAAEAALHAWLAAGATTPAPPGLDAGDDAVDAAAAARALGLLLDGGPEDGRLLLARARALMRAGQGADAGPDLERAALAGPPPVTADALLLQEARLARRPLGAGWSPAKAARLAAVAPWWPEAHEAHARALEREGDPAAGADAWMRAAARAATPAEKARLEAAAAAAREAAARRRRNAGT